MVARRYKAGKPSVRVPYPGWGRAAGGPSRAPSEFSRPVAISWAVRLDRGHRTRPCCCYLGGGPGAAPLSLPPRRFHPCPRMVIRMGERRGLVQAGLNKGEARNALARAVFFNRL